MDDPPLNPAGEYQPVASYDEDCRARFTAEIGALPSQLGAQVEGLSNAQLDTKYRNWTVRQIVHHIADSHVHSFIRFRWALTEDNPIIKAYEEADWVELQDSKTGDTGPSLALLSGLHCRWVQMLDSMDESQYARTFQHPQTGETMRLWDALNYYPWHGRHHTAQITWVLKHRPTTGS